MTTKSSKGESIVYRNELPQREYHHQNAEYLQDYEALGDKAQYIGEY